MSSRALIVDVCLAVAVAAALLALTGLGVVAVIAIVVVGVSAGTFVVEALGRRVRRSTRGG